MDLRCLSLLQRAAGLFGTGTLCRELACAFSLAYPSREIAAGLWFRGFSALFSFPETAGKELELP